MSNYNTVLTMYFDDSAKDNKELVAWKQKTYFQRVPFRRLKERSRATSA